MHRLTIVLLTAMACAVAVPQAPSRAGAAAGGQGRGSEWPSLSNNVQWLMIEDEPMLDRPGGATEVIAILERAKASGYNGLVLWDSHLWERQLPSGYRENAEAIKRALHQMDFTLMVQMCPRGYANVRWSGDETMCEPRPVNPHPDEKDYRYVCFSHPGVVGIWEEMLVRAEQIYHPMGWLLQYDEMRVAGTCARCRASGKSPGQNLADQASKTISMIRRVTPGRVVSVWTDMFDPNFNSNTNFQRRFHVNGTLAGAGNAIDRDVLLMQWNDKPVSFSYWSRKGNKQIVPLYFDREISPGQEASLMKVGRRTPGCIGWVYNTWQRHYEEIESYGRQYRADGSGRRASGTLDSRLALLAPPQY